MTDEQLRCDRFLTEFKNLENHLLSLVNSKEEHLSFSKALNQLYASQKYPLLSRYENYDFLKTAADLRNILSHENNVCAPSENFLSRFEKLVEAILHPLTCYSIATKTLFTCSLQDKLSYVMKQMEYHSLSHVPVLDQNGIVIGIFSRSTLFDYLSMNEDFQYEEEMSIEEFEEFLPLESHLNETYLFVSRSASIDSISRNLLKKEEHSKAIGLLLVTQNGKPNEKLLGVISLTDLNKYVI